MIEKWYCVNLINILLFMDFSHKYMLFYWRLVLLTKKGEYNA